ncbi:hypothetical protein [Pandoraea sp. NPDC087047]|uniref:hypothetical protein n=1 Tax=Pandoraea sp. NPDC087047 TaxID=3364390 RepID=UPI0037F9A0A4
MILPLRVRDVRDMVDGAARRRGTVTFKQLFSVFPEHTPASDVYDTLEKACLELGPPSEVIYSAVLAKKGDGLPGDGFFDMFMTHRPEEYRQIAAETKTLELTDEQRLKITNMERERIYAHASVQ